MDTHRTMDRPESPSRMSLASDWSAERPIDFQGTEPVEIRKSDWSETLSCKSAASGWSEERPINFQQLEPVTPKSKKAQRAESVASDWSEERPINFQKMELKNQESKMVERSESAMSDWSAERPINFRRTKSLEVTSMLSGISAAESGFGSMETDSANYAPSNIITQEHTLRSEETACDLCRESKLKAHILFLENAQLKKMIKDVQSENLTLKKENEELKQIVGELRLPDYIRREKTPTAANLTLNPDTAHSTLLLSNDGKRVRLGDGITVHQSTQRFDKFECVLAREGFRSGRHYWEVEVNREFTIGVTRESAQRKGKFTFCPSEGYWCLYRFRQAFTALEDGIRRLQADTVPRVLGVCIDVDEKWVAFYNTETKAHIYTFRNMDFSDGEKIYPVFNTLEKAVDLVIRTVR